MIGAEVTALRSATAAAAFDGVLPGVDRDDPDPGPDERDVGEVVSLCHMHAVGELGQTRWYETETVPLGHPVVDGERGGVGSGGETRCGVCAGGVAVASCGGVAAGEAP